MTSWPKMTNLKLKGQYSISDLQIPELHRQEAERQAKQRFVLSLLEQGDINLDQAQQLLGLPIDELIKLVAQHNIDTNKIDVSLLELNTSE